MLIETAIIAIGAYILLGPEDVNPPKHIAKSFASIHTKAKETHDRVRVIHNRDMAKVKKAVETEKEYRKHLREEFMAGAAVAASALAVKEILKLGRKKESKNKG